jgi:hypothetical protein
LTGGSENRALLLIPRSTMLPERPTTTAWAILEDIIIFLLLLL